MQKLKWHKFLVYFGMWAAAVINLISAVMYITGYMYDNAAEFYNVYGQGMKNLDVTYGILLVFLVALIVIACLRLAKFKRNAPTLLYYAIAANVLLIIGYAVAALVITGINTLTNFKNILQIALWVVFLILNFLYFKKREDIFNK